MSAEVWFVVCAENDCRAMVWGPCFSHEAAQAEANISSCKSSHFITNKQPREQPSLPGGCDLTFQDFERAHAWIAEREWATR